jgi:hypothetical protein
MLVDNNQLKQERAQQLLIANQTCEETTVENS